MAKLIFTHEKFLGQSHLLAQGQTTVGRGSQNALIIPDSSVSAEHCVIITNGTEVLIVDLSSANGTFIDDVRIHGQHPIKSGQKLRLGVVTTRMELQIDDEGTVFEEITAVRAHSRAVQQARQPAPPLQPATRLHTDTPSDPDGPTVTVKAPAIPPSQRPPQIQHQKTHSDPPSQGNSKVWIFAGLLLLVLALAYLIWTKFGR